MSNLIEDGKGRGYRAGVSAENELLCKSLSIQHEHHVAHLHQQNYSIILSVTPGGAGYVFAYIQNNDDRDLNITKFCFHVASNEYIEVYTNIIGTPAGTTVVTPVNSFIGSGNIANCNSYSGTNITGLSAGNLYNRYYIAANNLTNCYYIDSAIILPKQRSICLKAGTGTIQIDVNITFNFHEVEG